MNRLKELIEESGMKQKELAPVLNTTQQSVSRYINGKRDLNTDNIRQICAFFGCTADYLLCMSDQRTAQISDADAALLAAFYAAPENIQKGIREMLSPLLSTETSSALQNAQGGD